MKTILIILVLAFMLNSIALAAEPVQGKKYKQTLIEYNYELKSQTWPVDPSKDQVTEIVNTSINNLKAYYQDNYGKNFYYSEMSLQSVFAVEEKTSANKSGVTSSTLFTYKNGRLDRAVVTRDGEEANNAYFSKDGFLQRIEYTFPGKHKASLILYFKNDGKYISEEVSVNVESGDTLRKKTIIRDANGFVVKIQYFERDSESKTLKQSRIQLYKYNDKGLIASISTMSNDQEMGFSFEYNSDERISSISTSQNSKFEIEYYDNGLFREVVFSYEGNPISKTTYSLEKL
jgi:hypothetical protein